MLGVNPVARLARRCRSGRSLALELGGEVKVKGKGYQGKAFEFGTAVIGGFVAGDCRG